MAQFGPRTVHGRLAMPAARRAAARAGSRRRSRAAARGGNGRARRLLPHQPGCCCACARAAVCGGGGYGAAAQAARAAAPRLPRMRSSRELVGGRAAASGAARRGGGAARPRRRRSADGAARGDVKWTHAHPWRAVAAACAVIVPPPETAQPQRVDQTGKQTGKLHARCPDCAVSSPHTAARAVRLSLAGCWLHHGGSEDCGVAATVSSPETVSHTVFVAGAAATRRRRPEESSTTKHATGPLEAACVGLKRGKSGGGCHALRMGGGDPRSQRTA